MKKTLTLLSFLALSSAALAGPLEDKVNAYNNMRSNKPNTPVLDVRALLRDEVGVTSQSPTTAGNTCAICGLGTTVEVRQGAGGALPSSNPTANGPTVAASVLTAVPAGLGTAPGDIARTAEGTGAAWLPPAEDYRYASYESQYKYYKEFYDVQVINIINSYMDPNNGKLVRARVDVLNAVASDMANFAAVEPNASAVTRANYEAARIQAHSGAITGLTAQYQAELKAAREQFDAQMSYAKYWAENPQDQGGGGG